MGMVWMYVGFLVFVAALLALDLGVFHRSAHRIKTREAFGWSALWIALGSAFAGVVYLGYEHGWGGLGGEAGVSGGKAALTYLTAYVVEKSLAVDNIFVIALIFSFLRVPAKYQHRVLFWGIIGALLMRGGMIAAGATLVARFEWILYIFGAFLVWTGVKTLRGGSDDFDPGKSRGIAFLRRALRVDEREETDHGLRFVIRGADGRLQGTTLLLALMVVEACDVIFAVDSIPAVFAVTQDPFLVFTSNIMAILGLRSLYFVLADMMERFVHLKTALGIVMLLVGGKMLAEKPLHAWLGDHFSWITLVVVLSVLAGGVLASLRRPSAGPVPPGTSSDSV